MTIHVLTGDDLLDNFLEGMLEGSIAINRECLIEGPTRVNSLKEFWNIRESYLSEVYPESEINYQDDVAFEFEKLDNLTEGDEVNLWFEHDLFCQVNLWFTLTLLQNKNISIYRVYPLEDDLKDLWYGFGPMSPEELLKCYDNRKLLSKEDLKLGNDLWQAYASNDHYALDKLSDSKSKAFPHLKEVCKAQIDRPGRPEKVLQEIMNKGTTSFNKVFEKFSEAAGIYGFGNTQVRKIYDQLLK